MADTLRADRPERHCSDCGKKGTLFEHWGDVVPEGAIGNFCHPCFTLRGKWVNAGNEPPPLGQIQDMVEWSLTLEKEE